MRVHITLTYDDEQGEHTITISKERRFFNGSSPGSVASQVARQAVLELDRATTRENS